MPSKQTFAAACKHAGTGLWVFFTRDRNAVIHGLVTTGVLVASWLFSIAPIEWVVVLLCCGAVIGLEMINSAIERLCDLVHPDYHPAIKYTKDISAGAVLWVSIISVIIGCIIFLPKILFLLS